jgi:predicted dienelactone hydrolase
MRSHRFLLALLFVTFGAFACGDDSGPIEENAVTQSTDAGETDTSPDAGTDADDDAGDDAPVYYSVFERGPYNVGHRRWDITYDAELEPDRTIKLSVWYPTEDTEGVPGEYLVNTARMEVFGNASVAIEDKAPLLVFSHGNSSMAEQSYFMTEFWASHGWVVVAPYHTGNTIFDDRESINLRSGPIRPQDITATLDAMYDLPDDDPLAGKLSDDVVMSGHSFGGFTTLANSGAGFAVDAMIELCSGQDAPTECDLLERDGVEDLFRRGFLDERIDVAIPQAPGGYFAFEDGLADIEIPTMLMTGGSDHTLLPSQEGDPIWQELDGRHVRVDIRAAGHFTFSNMCDLLPGLPQVADDGCGDQNIDPAHAHEIINAYSLAFARYQLQHDEKVVPVLDGADNRWVADVRLQWKSDSALSP